MAASVCLAPRWGPFRHGGFRSPVSFAPWCVNASDTAQGTAYRWNQGAMRCCIQPARPTSILARASKLSTGKFVRSSRLCLIASVFASALPQRSRWPPAWSLRGRAAAAPPRSPRGRDVRTPRRQRDRAPARPSASASVTELPRASRRQPVPACVTSPAPA